MSPGAWVTGRSTGTHPWRQETLAPAPSPHCRLCVLSGGGQIHAQVGGTGTGPSTAAWGVGLQLSPQAWDGWYEESSSPHGY